MASSSTCAENEGQIVHVVREAAARRDLHFFQGRLGSGRSAGQRALSVQLRDWRHSESFQIAIRKNAMTRASKQWTSRYILCFLFAKPFLPCCRFGWRPSIYRDTWAAQLLALANCTLTQFTDNVSRSNSGGTCLSRLCQARTKSLSSSASIGTWATIKSWESENSSYVCCLKFV